MSFDDVEKARKKIMSATTDSEMCVVFDEENKPGISNLINIYRTIKNRTIEEVEKEFEGKNYGEFKKVVADAVVELLTDIQTKYKEIINSDTLDKILDEGKELSIKIAKEKYELMKKKMGVVRN